jgi:hypothetical protein
MNYGASSKTEYALNDGTVFEVYTFVEKSVVFKDILKIGFLYVLGTETKYKVDTIKSMNIAIRYLNEDDRINEVKDMLKWFLRRRAQALLLAYLDKMW